MARTRFIVALAFALVCVLVGVPAYLHTRTERAVLGAVCGAREFLWKAAALGAGGEAPPRLLIHAVSCAGGVEPPAGWFDAHVLGPLIVASSSCPPPGWAVSAGPPLAVSARCGGGMDAEVLAQALLPHADAPGTVHVLLQMSAGGGCESGHAHIAPHGFVWMRLCEAPAPSAPLLAAAAIVRGPSDPYLSTDVLSGTGETHEEGFDASGRDALEQAMAGPAFRRWAAGRLRERRSSGTSTGPGLSLQLSWSPGDRVEAREGPLTAVHSALAPLAATLSPYFPVHITLRPTVEGAVMLGDPGVITAEEKETDLRFVLHEWALAPFEALNSHLRLRSGAGYATLHAPLGNGSARVLLSPPVACDCAPFSPAIEESGAPWAGDAEAGRSLALLFTRYWSRHRNTLPCAPSTTCDCGGQPFCRAHEGLPMLHVALVAPPPAISPLGIRRTGSRPADPLVSAIDLRGWGTLVLVNGFQERGSSQEAEGEAIAALRRAAGLRSRRISTVIEDGAGRSAAAEVTAHGEAIGPPGLALLYEDSPLEPALVAWEKTLLARRWWVVHTTATADAVAATCEAAAAIPSLRIPPVVAAQLHASLSSAHAAVEEALRAGFPSAAALALIQIARAHAASASGEPAILPDTWLPPAHIAAIYAPMWAPLLLPLAIALLKGLRELRAKRRAAREALHPHSVLHPTLDSVAYPLRRAGSAPLALRVRPATRADLPALRLLYISGQMGHLEAGSEEALSRTCACHFAWTRTVLVGDMAEGGLEAAYGGQEGRARLWVATVSASAFGELTAAAGSGRESGSLSVAGVRAENAGEGAGADDEEFGRRCAALLRAAMPMGVEGPLVRPSLREASVMLGHAEDKRLPADSLDVPQTLLTDVRGDVLVGCIAAVPVDMTTQPTVPSAPEPGWSVARARVAELKRLLVARQAQRSGVASTLVDHLEAWAAGSGYSTVYLSTLSTMGPACKLYRGRGYSAAVEDGREEPYAGAVISVMDFTRPVGAGDTAEGKPTA